MDRELAKRISIFLNDLEKLKTQIQEYSFKKSMFKQFFLLKL